ncbi:oxidoreductase-like protein [Apiospora arundinis]
MKRLVATLIASASLGCQTVCGRDPGMVYGFDKSIVFIPAQRVSFDPRGVNNSDLAFDCFSGNVEARAAFNRAQHTGITNASSTSLAEQYYSSGIYGGWCNHAVENGSPHSYYRPRPWPPVDPRPTPSYGTVIGTTFASLFPDRVGRMVLDGVVDAEEYYNNDWRSNINQMDEAMGKFVTFCHDAGPKACAFWGPTPANITARLDGLIRQLQSHPVPISGPPSSGRLPALVTYADLAALFMNTIYSPVLLFPTMAGVLRQLEGGNATALAGMFDALDTTNDAGLAIRCADTYRRNNLVALDDYRSLSEYAVSKSKYLGDIYPIFFQSVLCRSFQPQLSDSMVFQNPVMGSYKPTSFPILFTSNTIDPVASSARKMSSRFPGSVTLFQEAVGVSLSRLLFDHITAS